MSGPWSAYLPVNCISVQEKMEVTCLGVALRQIIPNIINYYYIFLYQTLQTGYDIAGLCKCIWIAPI